MKILVVDDSQLIVSVIKNFIKKEYPEAQVIIAHTGDEAISLYNSEKPNLVFLDIKMPGMDGLTALKHIREDHPHAKIVMCTALKEPEEEEIATKAGAVGYIKKPFSKEDIVSMVSTHAK